MGQSWSPTNKGRWAEVQTEPCGPLTLCIASLLLLNGRWVRNPGQQVYWLRCCHGLWCRNCCNWWRHIRRSIHDCWSGVCHERTDLPSPQCPRKGNRSNSTKIFLEMMRESIWDQIKRPRNYPRWLPSGSSSRKDLPKQIKLFCQ